MAATKLICLFLILGLIASPIFATQYEVGDSSDWNLGFDFDAWASGKTFHVGDVLHFTYSKGVHDVVQLKDSVSLDICDMSAKLFSDDSGNTSFVLNNIGSYYFTSSLSTDCIVGNLKLKISVV